MHNTSLSCFFVQLYAELDTHKSPSELPASQQQVSYADVRH